MKVSKEWLSEYIDVEADVYELSERITRGGIEVDDIIDYTSDIKNLVIGHVEEVRQHPDADKLNLCRVNTGDEVKQIVCGADNVAADTYVIVCQVGGRLPGGIKIKKAKLRGEVSEGMICSLDEIGIPTDYVPKEYQDGIFIFSEDQEAGAPALPAVYLDDAVMEFDLTPNRKDALSIIGAAYETKALYGGDVVHPSTDLTETGDQVDVSVRNEDSEAVPYYALRVVKDVEIKPAPTWMQIRLIKAGIRPINNVVDISNYVMLEYGQPLHMFDYDQLGSKEIVTRFAEEGEKMTTLDGKERTLKGSDIVITNGKEPVALAGVMGGDFSEVTEETTNVIIESAVFNPVSIRKTSGRLDLRSEASSRFEKGVSHEFVLPALERAAYLLETYAGGKVQLGYNSDGALDTSDSIIKTSRDFINNRLGMHLETSEIEETLSKLGLETVVSGDDLEIHVPSRRDDLQIPEDITEEVARIYGYDALPSSLPKFETITPGRLTDEQEKHRIIRHQLESLGLSQSINYALTSKEKATQFTERKEALRLMMPMSEDRAVLRNSLVPHLVDNVVYNTSRQQKDVQLFETGRIFISKGQDVQPEEVEKLAGILTGRMNNTDWLGSHVPADFYAAKGILDSVFEKLGLTDDIHYVPSEGYPEMHPGRTADITLGGEYIGFVGELHPKYERDHDLDQTIVFEVDLDALLAVKSGTIEYEVLPKYPSVIRDIALVADRNVTAGTLVDIIENAAKKHLIDVYVFDVYEGENIEADKKSVAIRLTYLNKEETLTDEAVEEIHQPVLEALKDEGFALRG
ncbi:phenylalanine--tRNA ligase subunit beta [Salinicoccus kekensis]|uniref:Phenylalanine--tRNA ligase beta subunit n=1 Tax=Salinicoccus kekensis TaxID=714307 RepID=A0A285UBK6_9STAP|nr:phenylalanine--tRNA ligase subunit beta [Salinicoccus kekensis]SOC39077.1 phenylalanyl-tRNA synthetase beta subunit [Salinicoccus kekensis]